MQSLVGIFVFGAMGFAGQRKFTQTLMPASRSIADRHSKIFTDFFESPTVCHQF